MTERPILFSSEMVQAILGELKTQTRRVIRRVPVGAEEVFVWPSLPPMPHHRNPGVWARKHATSEDATDGWVRYLGRNPYGWRGDRLWVRESWRELGSQQRKDGGIPKSGRAADCVYKVDDPNEGPFRPSIHMPRWASRITLEVNGCRAERVQDISDADVAAEGTPGMIGGCYGCQMCNNAGWTFSYPKGCPDCKGTGVNPRGHFRKLWDSINAKRGYGWDTNPWVLALTFRRIVDAEESPPRPLQNDRPSILMRPVY